VEKMSKLLESVNKRDFDRRISEVVEMLEEKQLYGTISLIKDLKYYLDLATKEKTHNCNCKHNNNSRDNEPCCRCDSRITNADRIRNMSDEELADYLATVTSDTICGSSWDYDGWIKELQSEAE
jgi:hypothetical protein